MKPSKAVRASVLIALIAEIAVTEATRERITVKNHGVKFKVDWWDDGRAYPYRVWFTKNLVSSKYTFDAAGRLAQLYVDEAGYTFSTDTGEVQPVSDRMLLSGQQETQADETEMEMEMEMEHRRLYDCPDCEQTWDTMCDIGLEDVCYWANEEVDLFNDDTVTSLNKMCIKFTKECTTSAETTCQGMCTEGGFRFSFRRERESAHYGKALSYSFGTRHFWVDTERTGRSLTPLFVHSIEQLRYNDTVELVGTKR